MSTFSTIAEVARVRSLGGLSADESTGAPTASQIQAALLVAQQRMYMAVTRESYEAVRDFSTDDLTDAEKKKKQDDYTRAEGYFALATLPFIAKNQQFGQNGMVSSVQVGQGTTSYINSDESDKIAARWEGEAMKALADYIVPEDEDDELGVTSDDGSFSFDSI